MSIIIPFLLREKLKSEFSLPAQVSSWEAVELGDTGVLSQRWSQDALPPAMGHGFASGLRTQAPFLQMAVRVHTVPHPTHQLTVTGSGTSRGVHKDGGVRKDRGVRKDGDVPLLRGQRVGPAPRTCPSRQWTRGGRVAATVTGQMDAGVGFPQEGQGAPDPCSAHQLVTRGSSPAGSFLASSKTGLAPPLAPRSQPYFRESLRGRTSPSCRSGPGHSGAQVEVLNE